MTKFEIKEYPTFFHRTWRETYFLLFFNLGLIIGNVAFFSKHYLIIELCVFGLLIFKLINKRNRQIIKLIFDDKHEVLIISYLQFVFFRFTKTINYNLLQYNYRYKTYVRGKAPKTLELKEREGFVAEIKQKYNFGWTNQEVESIYETLDKIKQNENNI
jgi:hypothetical protein